MMMVIMLLRIIVTSSLDLERGDLRLMMMMMIMMMMIMMMMMIISKES